MKTRNNILAKWRQVKDSALHFELIFRTGSVQYSYIVAIVIKSRLWWFWIRRTSDLYKFTIVFFNNLYTNASEVHWYFSCKLFRLFDINQWDLSLSKRCIKSPVNQSFESNVIKARLYFNGDVTTKSVNGPAQVWSGNPFVYTAE